MITERIICPVSFDKNLTLTTMITKNTSHTYGYMIEQLHFNRRYLIMLRQKRDKEEKMHRQEQQKDNEKLEMISKSLSNHNLPSDVVEAFEALREQIISRYEERRRWWDERWQPLYEPEDLR